MFDENGLGDHRTQTSGPGDPENGGDEMDQENNQIVHLHMVTRGKGSDSGPVTVAAKNWSILAE